MARRRVFKTKVECSALNSRTKRRPAIGQTVTLQKSASGPEIEVVWSEGTVVGRLDPAIGVQVASAIDRGQSFTAIIENAYQLSGGTTWIHLKVEYLLDQGQRAIEVPKLPPLEPKGEWRTIYTKVAGVTHPNSDGSDRQKIIVRCRVGEHVQLVREPDNPYDRYAVRVLNQAGEQIGYIPAEFTGNDQGIGWCVGRNMDRGEEYIARVANITGGAGLSYGMNLQLVFWNGPLALRPPGEPALRPLESRQSSRERASSVGQIGQSTGARTGCIVPLVIALVVFGVLALVRSPGHGSVPNSVPTPCIEALPMVASVPGSVFPEVPEN